MQNNEIARDFDHDDLSTNNLETIVLPFVLQRS